MSGPGRVKFVRVGDTGNFVKFEGISDNSARRRVNLYLDRRIQFDQFPTIGQEMNAIISMEDKDGGIVQSVVDRNTEKLMFYAQRYGMSEQNLKLMMLQQTIDALRDEVKWLRKSMENDNGRKSNRNTTSKRNKVSKHSSNRTKKRGASK